MGFPAPRASLPSALLINSNLGRVAKRQVPSHRPLPPCCPSLLLPSTASASSLLLVRSCQNGASSSVLDGSLESGKNGAKLLPADLNRPKGDSTFSAVDVLQAMAQDETACGITGIDDTAIVGSCMERQEPPAEEQAGGHLGDGIRVALLLLVAAEFAVQGSLLWSPLAAVVATASSRLLPRRIPSGEQANTGSSATRAEESLPGLLATEPETPSWMTVFLENWWPSVIERLVSRNIIKTLQEILDRKVPPYVSLQVHRFYLGKTPPQASGIRVLYTEAGRKMELMEVGAVIASQDLSIIISGKAPVVGRLMIDMNSFDVSGQVQLWTLPDERLVLINFKGIPRLKIGMKIQLFRQNIDAFRVLCRPIEAILYESLRELMQDRRRVLVPLEVEDAVGVDAVDGEIVIRVVQCDGLTSDVAGEGGTQGPHYQVVIRNAILNVSRMSRVKNSSSGNPKWKQQHFRLQTGDKAAIFFVDVHEITCMKRIGRAVVCAAALPDGCTAFWAAGEDGRPLAKRWYPNSKPWNVTIPLENPKTFEVLPCASVTLELSAVKWLWRQPPAPFASSFVTPGPRSVILRVLEAHNVGDSDLGTRFVQVKYNGITRRTQVVTGSQHPVWDSVFVFDEDQSPQTRVVRLKVLSPTSLAGLRKDQGCYYLNLDCLYEGSPLDSWVELGGTNRGRLHIVAEIVPGRADSRLVQEKARREWLPDFPFVKVEVVSASDLPAGDLDGSSDPYVVVQMGSASTQTQVVPKNLNPVFAHKAILPLCREGESLRVTCWDYDYLRADDFLGKAALSVAEMLREEGVEYTAVLPLARPANAADPGGSSWLSQGSVKIKLTRVGHFEDIPHSSSWTLEDDDIDDVDLFEDSVVDSPGFVSQTGSRSVDTAR